ncbi:hypothetical protein CS8_010160 [Cupriavidus sp. 8B]
MNKFGGTGGSGSSSSAPLHPWVIPGTADTSVSGRSTVSCADGNIAFVRDYPRSSTRWFDDDGRLSLVRTGAPRHLALLDAVKFLGVLTPPTPAHTGTPYRPGRRPGGLLDTLIDGWENGPQPEPGPGEMPGDAAYPSE